MPCTYTGSLEGDALLFAKDELDELTRLLCEASQTIESAGLEMSHEHKKWWKRHKKIDKQRKKGK